MVTVKGHMIWELLSFYDNRFSPANGLFTNLRAGISRIRPITRGVAREYMGIYPPKSVQVNFLWVEMTPE